jgi:NADPH-dependent 2,4-dienoyl-CoA reductase/sulfur reductase-like enzyme/rhodanese-related sulfurtransferase
MSHTSPLKIVIVGGVAGGMSCAARARRLSEQASITVFERGPYVSYANCGIPYALGGVIASDDKLLLQTPQSFKARYNVDVHVNSEVTAIDRSKQTVLVKSLGATGEAIEKEWPYDKLVLSVGAEPWRPPIEGISLPNVFALQTIADMQKIRSFIQEHGCKKALVIGGGFIGLEAAENLKALDIETSIVEYAPHVYPPADREIAEVAHAELRRNGIHLYLNARIDRVVEDNSLASGIALQNGQTIPADLIIAAVGIRSRTQLASAAGLAVAKTGVTVNAQMQTSDPTIYAVGDMVETEHRILQKPMNLALAGPANRQGRLAADHIFGRDVSYRGNVGTSVCKIFDVTIASVGLSVRVLRALGRNPEWVTVHPPDHAGYYPGSAPITLRVIFDRKDGKLLGAQAVGKKGVDKRIDVLSTAIQAGMTIFDLEHLELAYAPPYDSAKDPVNMAGFVGSNVLRGDVRIVHAEDLSPSSLSEYQLVDARSPGEVAKGYLKGAVNLPVNSIRDLVVKLDKSSGKKVLVYCQVGYRGYLAYRVLKQMGFENVVNLDGGFKTVLEGGYQDLIARDEAKLA